MRTIAHYQFEEELGRGGMGVVYRAKDTLIGRQVAIKALPVGGDSQTPGAASFRDALMKEARAAGQLTHPNIVAIHHAVVESDSLYIVMELVEGHTLDAELAVGRLKTPERALSLLSQAAGALDYAHTRGVVHRDVKPSNFLVSADGILKLTDFGIAKLSEATAGGSGTLSLSGRLVGTPNYMSPEQVEGQGVDGRSDQFSLAVVAWTLLTGERPFRGDTAVAVLYHIVHSPPSRPDAAPIPRAAIETLERALAKDRQKRFSNCRDFIVALQQSMEQTVALPARRHRSVHAIWSIPLLLALTLGAAVWYRRARTPAVPQATVVAPMPSQPKEDVSPKQLSAEPERKESASRPTAPKPAARPFTAPQMPAHTGDPSITEAPPVSASPTPPANSLPVTLPTPTPPKPQSPAVTTPKWRTGVITWDGKLTNGEKVTIDSETSHPGVTTGRFLQGQPVKYRVDTDRFDEIEGPKPENGWRRIVLQLKTGTIDHFTITWELMQ